MIGVYRTRGGRYEWQSVITDAIEAKGRWILLEAAGNARLVQRVNEREARTLNRAPVQLEAKIVNKHIHNGTEMGDIYVRLRREPHG